MELQQSELLSQVNRLTDEVGAVSICAHRLRNPSRSLRLAFHQALISFHFLSFWFSYSFVIPSHLTFLTLALIPSLSQVILEKRLGMAQLCLLLAVLVFMALTRGSRGEPVLRSEGRPRSRATSMREWGKRQLSLSGDWVNRFKNANPRVSESGGGMRRGDDDSDNDGDERIDISMRTPGGCRSLNRVICYS